MRQIFETIENTGNLAYQSAVYTLKYYIILFVRFSVFTAASLIASVLLIQVGSWIGWNFISVIGIGIGMLSVIIWLGVALPFLVVIQIANRYKPIGNVFRAITIVFIYGSCLAFYVYVSHLASLSGTVLNILVFAVAVAIVVTIFSNQNSFTQKPLIAIAAITIVIVPSMLFMPSIVKARLLPKASESLSDAALEIFKVTPREIKVMACPDNQTLCHDGNQYYRLEIYNKNNGNNLVWFSICNGIYHLYDNPGVDPYCGHELKPFMAKMQTSVISRIKKVEIVQPELEHKHIPTDDPPREEPTLPAPEPKEKLVTIPPVAVSDTPPPRNFKDGTEFKVKIMTRFPSCLLTQNDMFSGELDNKIKTLWNATIKPGAMAIMSISENIQTPDFTKMVIRLEDIADINVDRYATLETDGKKIRGGSKILLSRNEDNLCLQLVQGSTIKFRF